jgi:hypothetical protein
MSKKGAFAKLAAFGAAVAGVVFFWRKRQPQEGPSTPPTASDTA